MLPPPLSYDAFCRRAGVSRETGERLRLYLALLEKWSKRVNLVGSDAMADPWRRHFLDSAQLHPLILEGVTFGSGQPPQVVDLGSGAGFPGLVLGILGGLAVHLVESNGRKCAFLAEVARATGTDVAIHRVRLEALDPVAVFGPALADCAVARACAPLPRLLALARPLVSPEGICLFLKGAGWMEELTQARKNWNIAYDRLPSATDARGAVLRITGFCHHVSRPGGGAER